MVIVKTPVRISFLGGGTDYPAHYRAHGGQTLATTIDKYSYITVSRLHEFFDHRILVNYSKTEVVNDAEEIQHPSVRECLKFMGISRDIEIHYIGDLPARTGLGSSSSFTVALLNALHAFKGEMVDQQQLAAEAVHVEQERIRERVGSQDQYICALGGLRHLRFHQDLTVDTTPVVMPEGQLAAFQQRLLFFYTGRRRNAPEILAEQHRKTQEGTITQELLEMARLVPQGLDVLRQGGDLRAFGELLHDGWMLKRRFSQAVSSPAVDAWYARARSAGAIGGKLLGAGSGGFLLFFVEPERQADIREALGELRELHCRFERQGSSVTLYEPDRTQAPRRAASALVVT